MLSAMVIIVRKTGAAVIIMAAIFYALFLTTIYLIGLDICVNLLLLIS